MRDVYYSDVARIQSAVNFSVGAVQHQGLKEFTGI